jgi:hypothetical protein
VEKSISHLFSGSRIELCPSNKEVLQLGHPGVIVFGDEKKAVGLRRVGGDVKEWRCAKEFAELEGLKLMLPNGQPELADREDPEVMLPDGKPTRVLPRVPLAAESRRW